VYGRRRQAGKLKLPLALDIRTDTTSLMDIMVPLSSSTGHWTLTGA
jgi:hypothetical protein